MERILAWRKSSTFKYGVPMMVLAIVGSFGIREIAQIRYDVQKYRTKVDPALEQEHRKKMVTLEDEYEKIKNDTFDEWKNIRGPRPWEDSKVVQDIQRQQ